MLQQEPIFSIFASVPTNKDSLKLTLLAHCHDAHHLAATHSWLAAITWGCIEQEAGAVAGATVGTTVRAAVWAARTVHSRAGVRQRAGAVVGKDGQAGVEGTCSRHGGCRCQSLMTTAAEQVARQALVQIMSHVSQQGWQESFRQLPATVRMQAHVGMWEAHR